MRQTSGGPTPPTPLERGDAMATVSESAANGKVIDAQRMTLFIPDTETELTPAQGVTATAAAQSVKHATRKPKSKGKRKQRPEDSPPWLHPSGRWCRKIGKRWHYFGRDETKAMAEWDRVKKFLL